MEASSLHVVYAYLHDNQVSHNRQAAIYETGCKCIQSSATRSYGYI